MKIAQQEVVASVSESLKVQAADALQAFESSMQEEAGLSLKRWQLRLASGLNALVRTLGEQFQPDTESVDNRSAH